MIKRKILLAVSLVLLSTSVLLITSYSQPVVEPSDNGMFVLSSGSWSYPDDYGQGIFEMRLYENSTGDWIEEVILYPNSTLLVDWNYNSSVKLEVRLWLNSTLVGPDDLVDGRDFIWVNVTVTERSTEVCNQSLSYLDSSDGSGAEPDQMWYYKYGDVLEFTPSMGLIYVVDVVYWLYVYMG